MGSGLAPSIDQPRRRKAARGNMALCHTSRLTYGETSPATALSEAPVAERRVSAPAFEAREVAMPFGAFEPETDELLAAALEAAWRDLERDEPKYSAAKKAKLMKALTCNLLAAAASGERDPQKLRGLAITGVPH
jgi:hypothetical protein